MSKIITLSADIIPKIAAGEVVERPASVVKELIENALDAGAKNILVEIEKAGLKKILVTDDGEGMDSHDVIASFLPHTTSKLHLLEDLASIKTMGFRGEALASICAVAEVAIKSCTTEEKKGTEILIQNSKIIKAEHIGRQHGTSVEVTDLFEYIPARKKFLRSESTEYQHILELLFGYAFGHVNVGFTFVRDAKLVFKIAATDNLYTRVQKFLGTDVASNMLTVNFNDRFFKITGFISKPQISALSKSAQYLFVNKRLIWDSKISKAVRSAYKTLLDAHSYPQYILFIELDRGLVDVNVHPRKEAVRFWDDAAAKGAVFKAVETTLEKNNLTFSYGYTNGYSEDKKAPKYIYSKLKDDTPVWQVRQPASADAYSATFQISETYIAYTDNDSLVLVDQHAAHESILYAHFSKQFTKVLKKSDIYTFKKPIIFELPLAQQTSLFENITNLIKLGFKIEKLDVDKIKVLAIPKIFKEHKTKELLLELVSGLTDDRTDLKIDAKTNRTIAYLACRTAIKAGDVLSYEEQRRLLLKLDECSDLYTCPHGRPIKIKLSSRELAKMFKRL